MSVRLKMKKRAAALLAFALLILQTSAMAANLSVSADALEVKAGDTVTLTVTVSGDKLSIAQGVFSYDPAVLTFVSASGGASDGFISMASAAEGGSGSLTAVIRFAAVAGGTTVINVSMDTVLDYNENKLEGSEAAVSITVTAPETAPTAGQPAIDVTLNCIPAENVLNADTDMYVWRSMNERTLPSRFADIQVEYHGEFIGGAAIPDTEFPVLLYLTDAQGENGAFYIYEAERDILYRYYTVSSTSASYISMLPPDGLEIPEGYESTTLEISDRTIPAWTAGTEGIYLIYARSTSGEVGFCLYDSLNESVQRYLPPVTLTPAPTPEPVATPEPALQNELTVPYTYAYIAAGVCAALLIAVIALWITLASKHTKKRRAPKKPAPQAEPQSAPKPETVDKPVDKGV